MDFQQLVRKRRSIRNYDRSVAISDAELRSIFEDTLLSPSSFNLQHWRFVLVKSPNQRKLLQDAAMSQPQITEASAVIVICAKITAHEDVETVYANPKPGFVDLVKRFYADPQLARDEALRSTGLSAMTLLLSATAHGYDSCPIIGFDPEAVSNLLNLDADYIPAMIVTLGIRRAEPDARGHRYAVDEVVRVDTLDGGDL